MDSKLRMYEINHQISPTERKVISMNISVLIGSALDKSLSLQ